MSQCAGCSGDIDYETGVFEGYCHWCSGVLSERNRVGAIEAENARLVEENLRWKGEYNEFYNQCVRFEKEIIRYRKALEEIVNFSDWMNAHKYGDEYVEIAKQALKQALKGDAQE